MTGADRFGFRTVEITGIQGAGSEEVDRWG
jgi:hypothetical protein